MAKTTPAGPDQTKLRTSADLMARATLDAIGRQWGTLGAGAAARVRARTVIDPEALLLASLALTADEPRLADVVYDFARLNADFLSVQRAKNLAGDYPDRVRPAVHAGLRWFARAAVDEGKDLRWEPLAKSEPVAAMEDDAQWPIIAIAPRANKSRGTRVRLNHPASLAIRLRLAFGVGVKADILAFLLTDGGEAWSTIRQIADALGYPARSIRGPADDLSASRFIQSRESQPTGYRADPSVWKALLEIDDAIPRWGSWRHRFAFAIDFLAWSRRAIDHPMTPYALGAQGRALLESHRAAFERDLLSVWGPHTHVSDWTEFVFDEVRGLTTWMRENG
jgi:hypothetical protein